MPPRAPSLRCYLGRTIAGLAFVAVLGAAGFYGLTEYQLQRTYTPAPEQVRAAGPEMRAEGKRLAKLYGCTSCHGADYRGLEYNDEAWLVRNYAPNLTLAAARYSDAELAQAIRQGIDPGSGRALWDMPSATFAPLHDDELAAVLAYLRSFPQGGTLTPADTPGVAGRLAILRGLWLGDVRSHDPTRAGTQQPAPVLVAQAQRHPPKDLGLKFAKGRHLTATICSECHGSDLGGEVVEGGPDLKIAAAYDRAAFHRLLRTGVPPGGRDLGIMSDTAREDFRVFRDDEIDAIYDYLKARAK